MSSSPDDRSSVLRGANADSATAARFAVDLRKSQEMPDTAAVEKVKQEARTRGYAEGWAQGQRAAAVEAALAVQQAQLAEQASEQRRAAALAQAVNALGRAVTALENQLAPTLAVLQDTILTHAFELAEAIVGRVVDDPEQRGADALRRAMSAATEHGRIVIHLHPDDYRSLLGDSAESDFEYEGRLVHLQPDPELRPGDALADTGTTTVDASIAAAVQRAREALRV
jgi:flagellar assembly protein FliH